MSREAANEWQRVMHHYAASGVITQVDRAALAAYCELYARAREAERALRETGLVITDDKGRQVPNPYVRIADRAYAEMRAYAVEFGMTPSSRSRVSAPAESTEDEFTKYLRDKNEKKAAGE